MRTRSAIPPLVRSLNWLLGPVPFLAYLDSFRYPLAGEFGWSREEVAGAASMGWLIVGLMNLPAGAMVDRFGPRRTLIIGGLLFGLGYMLMSGLQGLWQIYLFYVILAVGMSAADVVPLSTVARWFIKGRGTITGLAKIGAGVGMMTTPLVASYFIEAHGWRTAYMALGGIAVVALLIIAQFIRRDPSTMGLVAYGADSRSQLLAGLDRIVHILFGRGRR